MKLEDFGYNEELEQYRKEHNLTHLDVARVIFEQKEKYIVKTIESEYEAEIVGSMLYYSVDDSSLPVVGDWVAITKYDDGNALIHEVFPRKTEIERNSLSRLGENQIIAANIDYALITIAANKEFNAKIVEKYITICKSSKIDFYIIITKIDLVEKNILLNIVNELKNLVNENLIYQVDNNTETGYEALSAMMKKGLTYCLLGSSESGKSTLLNNLAENNSFTSELFGENGVSRELVILKNGGILIDNPNMSEIEIIGHTQNTNRSNNPIGKLSSRCKFKNCTHIQEPGCAVIEALESNEISEAAYHNFVKMGKNQGFSGGSKDKKKDKMKNIGKLVKQNQKLKKTSKFDFDY